ncbi:hypothetical protein BC826DRAFT_875980, partial [Russula brevipes]
VQELLARSTRSSPETSLHLIIADAPLAIWVHYQIYQYMHCGHPHTATQCIHLNLPLSKCERLAHLTNHIFAKGYLPSKACTLVSWKAARGKQIEESIKVEEM